MKRSEIHVGGHYTARISGKTVTVLVDAIRVYNPSFGGGSYLRTPNEQARYDVTNLATGRRTTFRSAQKFRRAVTQEAQS